MRRFVAEPASDWRCDHGEGPTWDDRMEQLLWVDQYEGIAAVGDWDSSSGRLSVAHRHSLDGAIGAVVPRDDASGWLVAGLDGFAELDPDGTVRRLAPVIGSTLRMNDGKCGPDGAFWAGSMAWDRTPGAGALYRLAPGDEPRTVLEGVTISNGLAWSADARRLFYIDTPTQCVVCFDVTDGGLANRRTVVGIAPPYGAPDGMTIDAEGCLWVALWNGWAVHRYSPQGELIAVVAVDAPQVSSCCFGGTGLDTLFITTSQEGMGPADRERFSRSGLVFHVDVGTRGVPTAHFAATAAT